MQFVSIEEVEKGDPLREFFVRWDSITKADAEGFDKALEAAQSERRMQSYLQAHPVLLILHLRGAGRYVIPQKRLGAEHVPDFLLAELDSAGMRWTAVELESPKARMFTKAGNPSATLTHAQRQILDWQTWLTMNRDYAAKPRSESGLGLSEIDSAQLRGLILIGRQGDVDPRTNRLRRQLGANRIEIHTYDWLSREALGFVKVARRLREEEAERRRRGPA